MLALLDSEQLERYALQAAACKGCEPAELLATVKAALKIVYRAVAFDIDGTLTDAGEVDVRPDMAEIVSYLLQRSVPVILITGRGRTSAREAADQIQKQADLAPELMRRLWAVTHNGVLLLRTPEAQIASPLAAERYLCPEIDRERLASDIEATLTEARIGHLVTREPRSARVILTEETDRKRAFEVLRGMPSAEGVTLWISGGLYGRQASIDVSPINKDIALRRIAALRGIGPERILRLGDQGAVSGNDHLLLACPAGFSVDEISTEPGGCLPVLSEDGHVLHAADATRRLLEMVLVLAPLSIEPPDTSECISSLSSFAREAEVQARHAGREIRTRLLLRVSDLMSEERDPHIDLEILEVDDIFDRRSGAVRFREWELDQIDPDGRAQALFGFPRHDPTRSEPPASQWSLYSDRAILARGPLYWYGDTQPHERLDVSSYIDLLDSFLADAGMLVQQLAGEPFTLVAFKLLAAVQDNVRNGLLMLLWNAYNWAQAARLTTSAAASDMQCRELYRLQVEHTGAQIDLLFDTHTDWRGTCEAYLDVIGAARRLLASLRGTPPLMENPRKRFRTRECDHFIENVVAVEIGLRKLRSNPTVRDAERLLCVGLVNGGIEYPAIAQVVSRKRGFDVEPAIAGVSKYSVNATKVRAAPADYVDDLLEKTHLVQLLGDARGLEPGIPTILMDDNCTTCTTLQMARDLLVLAGADVVGAVVARMPTLNRQVQMALPNHGFPDPDILFGFVRGLVAASPYARLLFSGEGGRSEMYLDQLGVFDKSEDRVKGYLHKNGTPAHDWTPERRRRPDPAAESSL